MSVKFLLLSPSFWQKSFETHNVYGTLAEKLRTQLEDKTVKEGGRRTDAVTLTQLITPENLKSFINRNVTNILGYANGKNTDLIVYIPVKILPPDLLAKNLSPIAEETPLTNLLTKLNMGSQTEQIRMIPLVGKSVDLILIAVLGLGTLLFLLLTILTDRGQRFLAPGMAFLTAGIMTILSIIEGNTLRINMAKDLVQKSSAAEVVLGYLAPPLIYELLKNWLIGGAIFILVGATLLYFRKK